MKSDRLISAGTADALQVAGVLPVVTAEVAG
jgi:hypothetical protein